jgi:hypothetical protein
MPAFLPRVVLIAAAALAATAGITYGASQSLTQTPKATTTQPLTQKRATLVVPDLRRQAFVFAKGALRDAGFAWRVVGPVKGYAANAVLTQSPAPGTRVIDTGAPLIKVTLSRNSKYPQDGAPEDISPYKATAVVPSDDAGQVLAAPPSTTTVAAAPAPAATTPAAPTVTTTSPSGTSTAPAPSGTTKTGYDRGTVPTKRPAASAPAPATQAPAAQAPAATTAAPRTASPTKQAYPQVRPTAFVVAGAPREPLDEMPLPDRVKLLAHWLELHPKPTNASVRHWLYQNEWIVAGAKFGWWRGAEALKLLVAVDARTVSMWGIGGKSKAVAATALAQVEAKSR